MYGSNAGRPGGYGGSADRQGLQSANGQGSFEGWPQASQEVPVGTVRALVASDLRLYREGLLDRLAPVRCLEVVDSVADPASTLAAVQALVPDLVLLDLAMPGAIELACALGPVTKVVVLSVHELEEEVIACAEAGVSGYVTREASFEELVEIVECVARGDMPCTPRIGALLLERVAAGADRRGRGDSAARLTRRELEVVGLIDTGLSNKQIARELSIELATVKNHVHSILGKLEVSRREDAARRVHGAGVRHFSRD